MSSPRRVNEISEPNILRAIRTIERLVLEGYSMPRARKAACGFDHSAFSKAVKKRDEYLAILNFYMSKRKNQSEYIRDANGKLKPISKSK